MLIITGIVAVPLAGSTSPIQEILGEFSIISPRALPKRRKALIADHSWEARKVSMSRRFWFVSFLVLLACLLPLVQYSLGWYQFRKQRQVSLEKYRGRVFHGDDPLSTELHASRQNVYRKLQQVQYPMRYDPCFIYVLPWCENSLCGLHLIWFGEHPVSGVDLKMAGGERMVLPFNNEALKDIASRRGLAKEVSFQWAEGLLDLDKTNYMNIETVTLVDVESTPIGNTLEPRDPVPRP